MMSYVIDLETTIRNTDVGKNRASPWHKDNEIVVGGHHAITHDEFGEGNHRGAFTTVFDPHDFAKDIEAQRKYFPNDELRIVAHNAKFDLGYLIRYDSIRNYVFSGEVLVWDTMLAEFMIEAGAKTMPSLDYVSEKYGLPLKDNKIKDYWNKGVGTEHIPMSELLPYLEQDVANTEQIYKRQLQFLKSEPLLYENICLQMEALVTTLLMEYNGMYFDSASALTEQKILEGNVEMDRAMLIGDMVTFSHMSNPNPSSPQQIATHLYGGEFTEVVTENMLDDNGNIVHYKSGKKKGQVRTKNNKYKRKVDGIVPKDILPVDKKTDDKTLQSLCGQGHAHLDAFIDMLLNFRKKVKDIRTYYVGYSQHVWPDQMIRTNFNHCVTPTGRLSSSNPNLQNVTRKSA